MKIGAVIQSRQNVFIPGLHPDRIRNKRDAGRVFRKSELQFPLDPQGLTSIPALESGKQVGFGVIRKDFPRHPAGRVKIIFSWRHLIQFLDLYLMYGEFSGNDPEHRPDPADGARIFRQREIPGQIPALLPRMDRFRFERKGMPREKPFFVLAVAAQGALDLPRAVQLHRELPDLCIAGLSERTPEQCSVFFPAENGLDGGTGLL